MDISLVLAVSNKLELTKECYKRIRILYPNVQFIISSGGSSDGTDEWLESLKDDNLIFSIKKEKLTFSENFNNAIKLVRTDKLILIHNDMVLGNSFVENMDNLISEDTLLSYTTIEPPIYTEHKRPGKVIIEMGRSFNDFNQKLFDEYVYENNKKCELYDGAVFFCGGYKKLFEDVGYFDDFSFVPAFCEDDDFLIRTKLKGYNLKTTPCAISYHFVSKTSRNNDSFKNEINSNRNFIRKWGIPIYIFHKIEYWRISEFKYKKLKIGLIKENLFGLTDLEPFFDVIKILNGNPEEYIIEEEKNTNYKIRDKFVKNFECDVVIEINSTLTKEDVEMISMLRLFINSYDIGKYKIGNLVIEIINK